MFTRFIIYRYFCGMRAMHIIFAGRGGEGWREGEGMGGRLGREGGREGRQGGRKEGYCTSICDNI